MKLQGKTALITGASQGLGAATAREMAARGAEVLLLARSEDNLREVASTIERSGGRAHVHPVDLADLEAVVATTGAIKAEGVIPDVIVNNAGIGRWMFVEETPLEEMQAIMAVPYFAAFAVTKAFISEMAERGSGNVCNVNGPGAWYPWPSSVAYASARWALRGFSAALRVDLRGTGVTVTDVVMARIASTYWENNPGADERVPWIDHLIPTMPVEQAARVVTDAVERERREATGPPMYTAFHQIGRLFPRFAHWCVYVGGAKRPRAGSARRPARALRPPWPRRSPPR